jgi:hypothetical protein
LLTRIELHKKLCKLAVEVDPDSPVRGQLLALAGEFMPLETKTNGEEFGQIVIQRTRLTMNGNEDDVRESVSMLFEDAEKADAFYGVQLDGLEIPEPQNDTQQ